jgi:metal-responsive CopG/Arc/MetJ family transcriptional regulator
MRTTSLKLPEALDERLEELARSRHVSRSFILREALEAYTASSGLSVTRAAGALVGALKGPEDLSTAPEHLEGYGA